MHMLSRFCGGGKLISVACCNLTKMCAAAEEHENICAICTNLNTWADLGLTVQASSHSDAG